MERLTIVLVAMFVIVVDGVLALIGPLSSSADGLDHESDGRHRKERMGAENSPRPSDVPGVALTERPAHRRAA